MLHGRQLRLFLSDGSSTGPRFYEIVNRTIQALGIPATRIKEANSADWPEFQKPGVYLVHGTTEEGAERLYIGRGENVANRVQVHPDGQSFEVTSLLLFSSKDENLNASQVGWLESNLIQATTEAKKITLANGNCPKPSTLSKPELATVSEFLEDLKLIAQTAGYDFFEKPKVVSSSAGNGASNIPKFVFSIPSREIAAHGLLTDEGFVVLDGSQASGTPSGSMSDGHRDLRHQLIEQGILIVDPAKPDRMIFTQSYAFKTPSPAAVLVAGTSKSGMTAWKTSQGQPLGDYLKDATS